DVADASGPKQYPGCLRCLFSCDEPMLSIRPFVMPEITDRHPPRAQFPRKFDELTGQISEHVRKSGSVTSRMGEAFNDSYADWIATTDEYDGKGRGWTFGRCRRA